MHAVTINIVVNLTRYRVKLQREIKIMDFYPCWSVCVYVFSITYY